MKHNEWFTERVGDASILGAATKSGLSQATLNRQLKRGTLPAESVIKISRAYDYNPVQGLVDTGYLDAEETGEGITVISLSKASDHELLAEVLRRIDTGKDLAELWERPLDEGFVEEIIEESQLDLSVVDGSIPLDAVALDPGYAPSKEILD